MKRHITLSIISIALLCGCAKEIAPDKGNTIENNLDRITITLGDRTRTEYSYEDQQLKARWSAGDIVSVTPNLYGYSNAGEYEVENPGNSTSTFKQKKAVSSKADVYGIFYPGTQIKSTAQFTKFEYSGQVQKKSDPMAHLGAYHSMRTSVSDYSTISFAGADQSSCMKFNLSGMTFDHPTKIEMEIIGEGKLYINNAVKGQFSYVTGDNYQDPTEATRLSVNLEGYGSENSIEAWMMMSNAPVTLYAGDKLRVSVYCEKANGIVRYHSDIPISEETTLSGGYCHHLTIQTGWEGGSGDFNNYDWDGEVVTLQKGKGRLDLVLMGDGFIKEDFDNGTYEKIMRQACEEFFSIEPFTTLKDGFNVFYVKTPSPERILATNTGSNGAVNTGHITKFSTTFTANSTSIEGDNDLVREYALKAFTSDAEERIKDATIVVIANQECRAGTCVNSWYSNNGQDYGQANAIAYCALGTSQEERVELMHHEICGHGFGKLNDEYYYSWNTSMSTSLLEAQDEYHKAGLFRNVDKYIDQDLYDKLNGQYPQTNKSNVYWHDLFGTSNNYESENVESIGIFKGGNTYPFGFCRPTEDANMSIMNNNTGIFNAISRRAIYYRYRRLSGEVNSNSWGTEEELNAFLKWDAEKIMPKLNLPLKSRSNIEAQANISAKKPLAPPVLKSGYWKDGRFYEADKDSDSRNADGSTIIRLKQ